MNNYIIFDPQKTFFVFSEIYKFKQALCENTVSAASIIIYY